MTYDRYVEQHPGEYFEVVKVTRDEDCLAFTKPAKVQELAK